MQGASLPGGKNTALARGECRRTGGMRMGLEGTIPDSAKRYIGDRLNRIQFLSG